MIDLAEIARSLVAEGKGLLAADESVHTATARLALYGIAEGEDMRRAYRDLFLEAEGIERYLSGVILFSETFGERGSDGKWFPQSISARGVLAGIKVDEGTEPFPDSPKEFLTKGLFGLPERFKEFREKGATFAKWRAVFPIDGDRLPSSSAIVENAKRLAKYAREAQEYGIVPIVEPEVLLEGAHARARAEEVIKEVLGVLFAALAEQSVDLPALILKTAMALSGSASGRKDTPEEVAESTLAALLAAVPRKTGGVVFLSGGQSPEEATENLAAVHRRARIAGAPWPLTFSYARALQEEALALWGGKPENVAAARAAFLARLAKVSAAVLP
ncbi:MAG TPA: class I fructose-bisphosphate aldolase [Candidatus Paceibacterota bacterium]|nr:class I fructose-bisphosphate aldolase [Candidatus Paceibacterota bacterium]